jgi:hypothetical protein
MLIRRIYGHLSVLCFCVSYDRMRRGRQDLLFFDLKSNQSLDLFILILDFKGQSFKK